VETTEPLSEFVTAAVRFVMKYPERTTPELRAAYAGFVRASSPNEQAECRYCGKAISQFGDTWLHATGGRGCRAATFDPDVGWDYSLDRKWRAAPREVAVS
jgi:hypothetical protein